MKKEEIFMTICTIMAIPLTILAIIMVLHGLCNIRVDDSLISTEQDVIELETMGKVIETNNYENDGRGT